MVKVKTDRLRVAVTPAGNVSVSVKSDTGKVFEILMGRQGAEGLASHLGQIARTLKGHSAFNLKVDPRTNLDLTSSEVPDLTPYDEKRPGFQVGVTTDRSLVTIRLSLPPSPKGEGMHVDLALPAQDAGVLIAALQASYAMLDPAKAPPSN